MSMLTRGIIHARPGSVKISNLRPRSVSQKSKKERKNIPPHPAPNLGVEETTEVVPGQANVVLVP